jgi:hypothetical protein
MRTRSVNDPDRILRMTLLVSSNISACGPLTWMRVTPWSTSLSRSPAVCSRLPPLLARAQEFLTERRVVFPAESALLRLVGEQKKLAHESIVTRIADFSFGVDWLATLLYHYTRLGIQEVGSD